MRGTKDVDLDEILLERYFIAPGSTRKIGSIHVDDEDLPEIFGTQDLESAILAFRASLPAGSLLKDYLSGDLLPGLNKRGKPNYVRILLFMCWMQTSEKRRKIDGGTGERDFRKMLVAQVGMRASGATMTGLDPMWEHLKDYLARNYGVELDLPEKGTYYVIIGRTLRLAFPTWRVRDAMRAVRDSMPENQLLNPLAVGNAIETSRRVLGGVAHSLKYNFLHFEQTRLHGGSEYLDTPFWRAWYGIVAETKKMESLEIREEEYGEYALYRVNPLGDRVRIASPMEAEDYIPRDLKAALSRGQALLEDLGFGRFNVTAAQNNRFAALMVTRWKLKHIPQDAIKTVSGLNSEWFVVILKTTKIRDERKPGQLGFGWQDGIRVGSAMLARSPIAPVLHYGSGATPTVEISGRRIEMEQGDGVLMLPEGPHAGLALARRGAERHEIRLVPRANETPEIMRQPFDRERHISEDEFYDGTSPCVSAEAEKWEGERQPACASMISIGEALYARSARTLALREAFEIVSIGLSRTDDPPSPWEIIRSFTDAGWFDAALLRNFPSRLLIMRQLSAEPIGGNAVRISGPTTIALTERIMACAGKAGATVERFDGPSPWTPPRYVVKTENGQILQDFLNRLDVPKPPIRRQAEPISDQGREGGHGYHVMDRLDEGSGVFIARRGETDGLFRMDRRSERDPHLYNSIVPGKPDRAYQSPSISMLFHQTRRGGAEPFAYVGGMLLPTLRRTYLPSTWARWLSDVTLANPGPVRDGDAWRYGYPATDGTTEAIARLVPVRQQSTHYQDWVRLFLQSAANRRRAIFEASAGRVRTSRTIFEKSFE